MELARFLASYVMEEIWESIAADSVDSADHSIEKLFDRFERSHDRTGAGHKRDDLTSYPVLFWLVST
jgi:hypothetical protein